MMVRRTRRKAPSTASPSAGTSRRWTSGANHGCIDDESPPGSLYGLYEGTPLTSRGHYTGASPDRITLFLATICASATTTADVAHQVRITLLHEVGHHFGIGEARLRALGWS